MPCFVNDVHQVHSGVSCCWITTQISHISQLQTNHPFPTMSLTQSPKQELCKDVKDAQKAGQARRELAGDWLNALDSCSFSNSTCRAGLPTSTNSETATFLSCTLQLLGGPPPSLCTLLSFWFSLTFFLSPLPVLGATWLYQTAQW